MTKTHIELTLVTLVVVTVALSLTLHGTTLAVLAGIFGVLAAGMHLSSLLDD
jgi:hypothetical protein